MYLRILLFFPIACFLILFSCKNKVNSKTEAKVASEKTDPVHDYFKSKEVSREKLMEEAKKKGIPYKMEENGIIYELQGFDETGMPIYYTTGKSKNSLKKD